MTKRICARCGKFEMLRRSEKYLSKHCADCQRHFYAKQKWEKNKLNIVAMSRTLDNHVYIEQYVVVKNKAQLKRLKPLASEDTN